MKNHGLSRRNFLRKTFTAGVAITGLSATGLTAAGLSSMKPVTGYNAHGLPTVIFGRTGVPIPRIAMGLGSRFCSVAGEDEALEMLTYALDHGLYYWDTAHTYVDNSNGVVSEERLGKILAKRRDEVFLSTKISKRDPDEAKREVETSLRRLGTDHLDNLMIHSVESVDDVEKLSQRGGVIDLVSRLKEEGVTRFIGFSGHSGAKAKRLMIERGDFDTVLFAMNQYGGNSENREEMIIPAALEKNMGILLMKVVRPKETIAGIDPSELIRYALSLDGPSGLVLGMDSLEVIKSNIRLLRNFKPMTGAEQESVASVLSPYFKGSNLEWMKEGYTDGHWG